MTNKPEQKYNMISDVSKLTTIPEKVLNKLITKSVYCISDAIAEMRIAGKDTIDLDIGLGNLSIGIVDDEVVYKFVPSTELDISVKSSILNEQNLLEDAVEASLVDKLTNTYKDVVD